MIDTDWELLDRYLAGECTPEERLRFERLLATSPQQRELVEGLRLAGARLPPAPALVPVGGGTRGRPGRGRPGVRVVARRRWRGLAVAAGLVLAMVAGVTARSRLAILRAARSRGALRAVSTRPAQRAEVRLPDGSIVVLGPASALHYRVPFARGARDVMLSGEAYFGVVHDAANPFVVRVGTIVVTDVGTAFDVRAYAGDPAVHVAVAEGEVRLETGRSRLQRPLHVHDLGTVTDTAIAVTHEADIAALTGWTQGRLVFVDRPLPEVLRQLGRWYDVDVQLGDAALATRRLTATFANDPWADVLHAMGRALDVRVEQDGRVVRLYGASGGRR